MEHQTDQLSSVSEDLFPDYLGSYDSLVQHFRGQLEGQSKTEKGDRFAHFAQRLVPQTEVGPDFGLPELRKKKVGDEGVDLIAQGRGGQSVLYIQAKLWVDRADDIDSVLSKFQAYLAERQLEDQQYRLPDLESQPSHFMLVTLSRLDGILKQYEKRHFASKDFYRRLITERRLHFVHGHQVLSILRAAYSKVSGLPATLTLNLETPVIHKDNVYFGIISSTVLRTLYSQSGDALFFEDIRDFHRTVSSTNMNGWAINRK